MKPSTGRAMRHGAALALALAAMLPLALHAQAGDRSGRDVVQSVCINCHGAGRHDVKGAAQAPRIGDRKAWSKLASQGLTGLSDVALQGIRQMPPHGGNMTLSDIEVKRAIVYMVNQSGGHWTEPTSRTVPVTDRSGEEIVRARCADCHAEGKNGAPRIGDRDAWLPRAKSGFDGLVRSAINGHGGMPARGGLANLTDAEMRSAVAYMVGQSIPPR